MEKIAQGRGGETKIARGEWEWFNWFILLVGLFEKIAKMLLRRRNEQQVTLKVHTYIVSL